MQSFRLPFQMRNEIEQAAAAQGVTVSEFIRQALCMRLNDSRQVKISNAWSEFDRNMEKLMSQMKLESPSLFEKMLNELTEIKNLLGKEKMGG